MTKKKISKKKTVTAPIQRPSFFPYWFVGILLVAFALAGAVLVSK